LMMSLWDALRMNMMISYQELVRTFPRPITAIPQILEAPFRPSKINMPMTINIIAPAREGVTLVFLTEVTPVMAYVLLPTMKRAFVIRTFPFLKNSVSSISIFLRKRWGSYK
ncbi:hypothetical protein, partial [Serratia nevei]|uniref:hypothetical protein n=1 Tax=Serratia nevei TaxID=2703794 RepID=UPI003FF01CB1